MASDARELERRVADLRATVRPLREALRLVVDDVDELVPKLRAVRRGEGGAVVKLVAITDRLPERAKAIGRRSSAFSEALHAARESINREVSSLAAEYEES